MRPLWMLGLAMLSLAAAQEGPRASAVWPVLIQLPTTEENSEPFLLGGWQDGEGWQGAAVIAGQLEARPYRARGMDSVTMLRRGEAALPLSAPCETAYAVPLNEALNAKTFQVILAAGTQDRPRAVEILPLDTPFYQKWLQEYLQGQGFKGAKVKISGLYRVDLDGDKQPEALIEASIFTKSSSKMASPAQAEAGDYSVLLLRWAPKGGRASTVVLGQYLAGSKAIPTLYRLAGIADLNGDKRMEVVVYKNDAQGTQLSALEWTPKGVQQTPLESRCGAS